MSRWHTSISVAPRVVTGGAHGSRLAGALFWHIKNLLEAVAFGIVDLEQAFLPYLLVASGQTVYEEAKPRLEGLMPGDVVRLLERPK